MRTLKVDGRRLAPVVVLVAMGNFALVGCGGGTVASGGDEILARRQLGVLASLYGDYLQRTNNIPPKDEAAFLSFLNEDSGSRLKLYNVDPIDELLVSARDKQPFVIVCGKLLVSKDSPDTPWAAYEKSGVEGKRLASKVRGSIEELTPEQFKSEFPGD